MQDSTRAKAIEALEILRLTSRPWGVSPVRVRVGRRPARSSGSTASTQAAEATATAAAARRLTTSGIRESPCVSNACTFASPRVSGKVPPRAFRSNGVGCSIGHLRLGFLLKTYAARLWIFANCTLSFNAPQCYVAAARLRTAINKIMREPLLLTPMKPAALRPFAGGT